MTTPNLRCLWKLSFLISVIPALALVILGIVVDPTTAGAGDSVRALGYEELYRDKTEKLNISHLVFVARMMLLVSFELFLFLIL